MGAVLAVKEATLPLASQGHVFSSFPCFSPSEAQINQMGVSSTAGGSCLLTSMLA